MAGHEETGYDPLPEILCRRTIHLDIAVPRRHHLAEAL